MQEIWGQSQSQEDPMEKGMVTHSSIVAWEIPWTEEPGGLQSMGSQRAGQDWVTNTFTYVSFQWYFNEFEIYIIKCYTKFNYESGFTFLLYL